MAERIERLMNESAAASSNPDDASLDLSFSVSPPNFHPGSRRAKNSLIPSPMALSLSRFSRWIWPGSNTRSRRGREPPAPASTAVANDLFPDSPSGFREPDAVGRSGSGAARPRKGKSRRRGGRGEAEADGEHGMVVVQSDGDGCLSDSDSDGSDWSIGWLEPLAPDLQSDGDSEGSFAVLVQCYRRGRVEKPPRPDSRFPGPIGAANGGVSDNKNFVEQWVSSLQN